MVSSSSSNSNYLFPTTDSEQTSTESLIRFHLVPETTALLTISQLSEVLKVETRQLVPLPKLPSWVMGLYNWRGEILWVVDLGGLVGLTPLPEQPLATTRLPLLVLRTKDETGKQKNLGLIVENVEGITRIDPNSIQSPPESTFTPELSRVLRGYSLTSDGEMLMVLSAEAIFAQMPNSIS
ncbi:CheW protein [Halothece sp. PCC 7418]|uniref:chemotaxis protein CheW n=1 Tax=Halothece sp. (strain PCC 7418) TaxID=65093 RepID=UPI0002A06F11|nr:chemotaxis protein CheW [Halothece sp. PCC 7418]AFZ44968.1 CheW protein [Halothece sp. PCC 7418]